MLRLTTALADRYAIERELGAGGMATVYLAHDVRHDRKVALKVLRPELAAILGGERFLKEIRLTANLQHPHILPLHDSGEADGIVYYVMPYVEGESLRDRLTREKQLPVEEAVRIAREVASALDYAHRHNVVHRDIKPENILLHEGQALVADFGIALAVSTAGAGTRITETGMSLGTPHYMSPEQAMGEREITPKSDVYSLGCVLYEMLVGEPPFTGPTAQAIIARVVTEEPRSLTLQRKTIPPHVEAVVRTALQKLPADRFQSATEFSEALARPGFAAVSESAAPAAVPSARPRAGTPVLQRVRAAGPWLLAAAFAGVALASWLRPGPPASPVGRFAVPLKGVEPAGFIPNLSPDGSRLVFVGQDSQRTPRLYLRALDREQPVPVAGTEGVQNSAFFSPDGQWILFRQGGKLRKVAITGGAVAAICDLPGAFNGVSWGPNDVVVFATTGDSVYRVPAAGGQPAALLGADTAAGTTGYRQLHFLPDGRTIVANRITKTGSDLVAISLESRRVSPLGIAGLAPHYVNGGWLVYTDASGTAFAVPFDARRARVTGAPEPLAENVLITQGFPRLSVARTGAIAYYTGGASANREMVIVSREGRAQAVPARAASYRYPRFSPDGRRLAVGVESFAGFLGDIWGYDFGSRRPTRLTFDSASANPEWTPDGRYLVYTRLTGGVPQLYRVAADGSADPRPYFLRPNAAVFESHLTPDGHRLVFREDNPRGIRDILVAPPDSPAAARPLAATSFNERGIALSPDGRWLAFTSNLSGANEVYVRRLDEGSPRWRVSTGGGNEPRWGPRGRELFYRNADSLYVVPVTLGAEARLGEPRALFGGRFLTSPNEPQYDVSPDGRQFVMVRDVGGGQGLTLHVMLNWFDQRRARGPAGGGRP